MENHRMSDDLQALQRRFQDYLNGDSEEFEKDIVSTDGALAEHRLGAYYNAYRIRLIDCLATDFPVLQKTLGDEAYEYLILDYLKLYPSEHPSVRWVGRHMVEFLQNSDLKEKDFLKELAAFEWTQGLCFDSKGSNSIVVLEDMAGIAPESWPQISLSFHPSVRWLDLHWNIPPYWVALDADNIPPEKAFQQIPGRWLMWRRDMSPNWRSLEVTEAWAIQAAYNGASFAELCEGLLEWLGEDTVAITAAGYLKQWIHESLITGIRVSAN
jgi:hypothetical protein